MSINERGRAMRACEICGNPLTNPRAKTCSTKCRTIKHRRDKIAGQLSEQEVNTLLWFHENIPVAGRALSELLAKHGKGALLLGYTAMNEYANFCEKAAAENFAVERAS